MADDVVVRKGQGDVKLSREQFEARLRERFYDPEFERVSDAVYRIVDVAWNAYDEYHKSPRTRKAGPGFADPFGFTIDENARARQPTRGRAPG